MRNSSKTKTMAIEQTKLDELRAKLEKAKARIEADLGVIADKTESGDFETKFPEDIGDRVDENATEVEAFTDNLAVEVTLESQLRDIKDALAKMDAGTYGICEKSGAEIPLARLEAYPSARTTVEAA